MLTVQEIMDIAAQPEMAFANGIDAVGFAKAIERAVLEKAREQLPVAIKGCGAWDGLECLDELPDGSALYAHPLPAQAIPEWMPIDTAPKEVEFRCLLSQGITVVTGYYNGEYWVNERSKLKSPSNNYRPTHWMPLPDTSMLSTSPKP